MEKIGFVDSGIGGISLLRNFFSYGHEVEVFYISDERNVPYGDKSQEFMLDQVSIMVERLLEKNVKLIVIACNTLTAETIDVLRSKYTVPFVGIEPYLNIVNQVDDRVKYGLILTEATYQSERFKSLQARIDPDYRIKVFPLKKLALLIEKLKYHALDSLKDEINDELDHVQGVESLILGCTHYPLIKSYIKDYLKLDVIIPDTAIVNRVEEILLLKRTQMPNDTFIYSSDLGYTWITKSINDFIYL